MAKKKIEDHHYENDLQPKKPNPDSSYSDDFVRWSDEKEKEIARIVKETRAKRKG